MKLLEYEAKKVFSTFGIPIPASTLITSAGEAADACRKIGEPAVLKAQVDVGGGVKPGAS